MAVREAMAGLRLAVGDERGTGHHLTIADGVKEPHFNLPGVTIWGKTGTASAPALYAPAGVKSGDVLYRESMDPLVLGIQTDNPTLRTPQGRRVLRFGDHSWFVVLVGREGEERPRFAVSVMMEYAGSGGKVSGPIVNQILWALRAEGYL
jgi:cell division protein FtsI/penicillin-binding protein 2